MPFGFGREEGLERRFRIVEADAVVCDLDHHGVVLGTPRADRQLLRAAADRFQGLERVQHEIQHELLQLNAIGEEGRQLRVQRDLDRDTCLRAG